MKTLNEVKSDGYGTDLAKLVGKKIIGVDGYVSTEFGKDIPVFALHAIRFDDGTFLAVEGEHDLAYLPGDEIGDEQLLSLYREENGADE